MPTALGNIQSWADSAKVAQKWIPLPDKGAAIPSMANHFAP